MAEHHQNDAQAERQTDPGFETSDAQVRPLAQMGVALIVIIAISIVGTIVLFKVFKYYQPIFDDPVPPLASVRQAPDAVPRLQIDPPRQKLALHQSEELLLTTYAWVDAETKRVRIPIDRAIALVAEGTLPTGLSSRPAE